MTGTAVEKKSLGSLEELGDGGEGRVYTCSNRPGDVYKEFRTELAAELDRSALERTMGLLDTMTSEHRAVVTRRTAWPHTIVTDRGRFVGFLMPRLGPSYFCRHGVKAYPGNIDCRWDLLTYRQRNLSKPNIVSDTTAVSEEHVLAVMLDLAELVSLLHRYRIVLGDISGRNLLWSTAQTDVMVIDCDGFRAEGDAAVTRSKQTPDWIDPNYGADTCLDSDRYKLGLAMFRAFFSAETELPQQLPPAGCDSNGQMIHSLAIRAMAPTQRPTADDWVTALKKGKRIAALQGRPLVELEAVAPPQPRSVPAPRSRPTIALD